MASIEVAKVVFFILISHLFLKLSFAKGLTQENQNLRDKNDEDSGVWIATIIEHHVSLKKDFFLVFSIFLNGW